MVGKVSFFVSSVIFFIFKVIGEIFLFYVTVKLLPVLIITP